jgi:hypothetical protein
VECRRPMTPMMLRQPSLRSAPPGMTRTHLPRKPMNALSLRRFDSAVSKGASPRESSGLPQRPLPKRRVPAVPDGQAIDFSA